MTEILTRIKRFRRAGLGLFLHYGIYSVIGRGEWARKLCPIGEDEYEAAIGRFTCARLDFDAICKNAFENGFRYVVFTARHHDGFSLYDTEGISEYSSLNYGPRRDLVGEFVGACKKYGLLPIVYHTTVDWHHPLYQNDFEGYLGYLRDSVKRLCESYPDIGGFWFDGTWERNDDWQEDLLYQTIRSRLPEAIIINNTGLNELGRTGNPEIDSVTFERGKPKKIDSPNKILAGEMCDVVNTHWGIASGDIDYKSARYLIESMIDCRRYNCNYLLNVPLESDGSFSHINLGLLEQIGARNRTYPFAMRALCYHDEGKDFFIELDGEIYLVVFGLGVNGDENVIKKNGRGKTLTFERFPVRVKEIRYEDNKKELPFSYEGNRLTIFAENFDYGSNMIVRIAKVKTE